MSSRWCSNSHEPGGRYPCQGLLDEAVARRLLLHCGHTPLPDVPKPLSDPRTTLVNLPGARAGAVQFGQATLAAIQAAPGAATSGELRILLTEAAQPGPAGRDEQSVSRRR